MIWSNWVQKSTLTHLCYFIDDVKDKAAQQPLLIYCKEKEIARPLFHFILFILSKKSFPINGYS